MKTKNIKPPSYSKLKKGCVTYSVSFAKMPGDHIVHVVIFTQVQLQ